jgi:hypothetical protein
MLVFVNIGCCLTGGYTVFVFISGVCVTGPDCPGVWLVAVVVVADCKLVGAIMSPCAVKAVMTDVVMSIRQQKHNSVFVGASYLV